MTRCSVASVQVSCTVRAFIDAYLPSELIELLEKIVRFLFICGRGPGRGSAATSKHDDFLNLFFYFALSLN